MKIRHLKSPPIVETVIEIRLATPVLIHVEGLAKAVKARFPEFTDIQHESQAEFKFSVGSAHKPTSTTEDMGVTGILVRSQDTKRIARFGRQVFMFSHLAPYPGWDRFSTQARELWFAYRELVNPVGSARLGLRTINRISVAVDETGQVNLGTIFNRPLSSLAHVDWDRIGLFISELYRIPNTGIIVKLLRAMEGGEQGPSVLVDVDASSEIDSVDSVDVVELAQELRAAKNKTFFSTVKYSALRRFE